MYKKIKTLSARLALLLSIFLVVAAPLSSQGYLNASPGETGPSNSQIVDSKAQTSAGPLVVTEILANADNESSGEAIELKNISTGDVDLADWSFVDSADTAHPFRPYPRDLSIGEESTILNPDELALILDKDYQGEYDAQVAAQSPLPKLISTTSGNLYLANKSDRVALRDSNNNISDDFSWSQDVGNLIPFARYQDAGGVLSDLQKDSQGPSFGFVRVSEAPPPTPIEPPAGLIISELLPNPKGSDVNEFIELFNSTSGNIDLTGFDLQDSSGKKYSLQGSLAAKKYLVLGQNESSIQLNNSSDELSLIFGDTTMDSTYYENAKEDQSWSRFDNDFLWTLTPTPGQENLLKEPAAPQEPTTDNSKEPSFVKASSIADLLKLTKDTQASVSGIVATKKDLFFKNSFHLVDKGSGVLISLPKGDQSEIKPGQVVNVSGTLGTLSGMPRLLLDKKPVVTGRAAPPVQKIELKNFGAKQIGRLILIKGQVSSRSGKSFRIGQNSDKNILVSVRSKSGITTPAPPKNHAVEVIGIALKSGEQTVLAPRVPQDIKSGTLPAAGITFWPMIVLSLFFSLALIWLIHREEYRDRSKSFVSFCDQ